MTKDKLRRLIENSGKTINEIERDLAMPQGTVSKAVNPNQNRNLAKKWEAPAVAYFKKLNTINPTPTPKWVQKVVVKPVVAEVKETVSAMDIVEKVLNTPVELVDGRLQKEIEELKKELAQYFDIEDFCNINNCTPQDLMNNYGIAKTFKKPDASLASLIPKTPASNYMAERQRKKLGM